MTEREELLQTLRFFKASMDWLGEREGIGADYSHLQYYLAKGYTRNDGEGAKIYDDVVGRIRELSLPVESEPQLNIVFADVSHPTCACGQVFGAEWTAGDAVEHQRRAGHEGFRFLMPWPRKGS